MGWWVTNGGLNNGVLHCSLESSVAMPAASFLVIACVVESVCISTARGSYHTPKCAVFQVSRDVVLVGLVNLLLGFWTGPTLRGLES
jgi:heme A synthase